MSDELKIPLADAIRALRQELNEAVREGEGEEIRFELGPVELELQVEVSKQAGGQAGVAFWLLSIGGSASRGTTTAHTVKLSLNPVDPEGDGITVNSSVPVRPD